MFNGEHVLLGSANPVKEQPTALKKKPLESLPIHCSVMVVVGGAPNVPSSTNPNGGQIDPEPVHTDPFQVNVTVLPFIQVQPAEALLNVIVTEFGIHGQHGTITPAQLLELLDGLAEDELELLSELELELELEELGLLDELGLLLSLELGELGLLDSLLLSDELELELRLLELLDELEQQQEQVVCGAGHTCTVPSGLITNIALLISNVPPPIH
jgi:hypothetical protein